MKMETSYSYTEFFTELPTTSSGQRNDTISATERNRAILYYTFLFSVAGIGNVLSLLVALKIIFNKKRISDFLVVCLSINDLLCLICTHFISFISTLQWRWVGSQLSCVLQYYFAWSCLKMSFFILILLTIDRYVALVKPIYYKTKFNCRRIIFGFLVCFVFSFGSTLITPILEWDTITYLDGWYVCFNSWSDDSVYDFAILAFYGSLYIFGMILSCFCSMRIAWQLFQLKKRRRRTSGRHMISMSQSISRSTKSSRDHSHGSSSDENSFRTLMKKLSRDHTRDVTNGVDARLKTGSYAGNNQTLDENQNPPNKQVKKLSRDHSKKATRGQNPDTILRESNENNSQVSADAKHVEAAGLGFGRKCIESGETAWSGDPSPIGPSRSARFSRNRCGSTRDTKNGTVARSAKISGDHTRESHTNDSVRSPKISWDHTLGDFGDPFDDPNESPSLSRANSAGAGNLRSTRSSRYGSTLSMTDSIPNRESRIGAVMLVMSVIFVIAWSPYLATIIFQQAFQLYNQRIETMAIRIVFANTALNPLLYGLLNRTYRRGYWYFLRVGLHYMTCCLVKKPEDNNIFYVRRSWLQNREREFHRLTRRSPEHSHSRGQRVRRNGEVAMPVATVLGFVGSTVIAKGHLNMGCTSPESVDNSSGLTGDSGERTANIPLDSVL